MTDVDKAAPGADLYRVVFNNVESGIVVQSADGAVVAANRAAHRILGLSVEQMAGEAPFDVGWRVNDEDGAAWPFDELPAQVSRRTGRAVLGAVIGVHWGDGTSRWIRSDSRPFDEAARGLGVDVGVSGETGGFAGTVTTFTDITDYKHLLDSLAGSESRFSIGFDNSPIGMALVSPQGMFVRVNAAFGAQVGHSRASLIGQEWSSVVSPEDIDQILRIGLSTDPRVGAHRGPVRLVSPSGSIVHAQFSVAVVHDPGGAVAHFFVQSVDVTQQVKLAEDLSNQAVHDYLTGVLNRRGFAAAAAAQWEHTVRYGDGGALLMIDLNDFKSLNDTLGHAAGDRLLTEVGLILTRRLRTTDVVARLGGDEFAVLLPRADAQTATDAAQAVLDELRQQAGPFGSASIGIALFNAERSVAETMFAADRAMYRAKRTGQPRWEIETPDEDRDPDRRPQRPTGSGAADRS